MSGIPILDDEMQRPFTNGDLFRAATDEQLAVLLTNVVLEAIKCYDNFIGIPREPIEKFHIDWLKQEVE